MTWVVWAWSQRPFWWHLAFVHYKGLEGTNTHSILLLFLHTPPVAFSSLVVETGIGLKVMDYAYISIEWGIGLGGLARGLEGVALIGGLIGQGLLGGLIWFDWLDLSGRLFWLFFLFLLFLIGLAVVSVGFVIDFWCLFSSTAGTAGTNTYC